jgi:cytochrome c oxidase subunit III
MTELTQVYNTTRKPLSMHPKKFALWLFIVSIVMMFAAMTSAYIVRQSEGDWLLFDLPSMFYFNTVIIVLSSVTMQLAYWFTTKDRLKAVKVMTLTTTFLAVVFLYGQLQAWGQLVANEVYFVGNPSGSFIYVISGLHAFHLITGIVFIVFVLFLTFKFKVHSKSMLNMEMCTTYWHFLGGLWLYLFIFLLLNN